MHYLLVLSVCIGLLYSFLKLFHNKISHFKSNASIDAIILFAFLKISTSMFLFLYLNGTIVGDQKKHFLALQLFSYTMGDIIILGNEIIAMLCFGVGHVFFLNLFMFHQFIEVVSHPALAIGLVGIPSAVFYFLPNRYKDYGNTVQIFHKLILILYMLLLYMVWMMPVYHWYFPGMALFVMSDLFIVFQWPGAWLAEYMLYLSSLISLYICINSLDHMLPQIIVESITI